MDAPSQRWWPGPLPADALAWDAVAAACRSTTALAARRGLHVTASTTPDLVAASFAALDHLRVDGRRPVGFAPTSGFFAAADGWVRLHANYPHHAAAVRVALGLGADAGADAVSAAVAGAAVQELEDRVVAAGGVAAAVRTEQEWAEHPHGRAVAADPWTTVEHGAERAPLGRGSRPLSGVRVLDLTRVIAGPTCSQLLGCLGADVLRVDPPHRPELLDAFLSTGMGKRSAEADLRAVRDEVATLLPAADVVLLGYRPGALHRFGLAPGTLAAEHPHLVVASLSAWGEQGPWGGRSGFDSIVQAACGIADACRGPDGRPGALAVQALDHATGYVLAAEVMTLLADARGGVVRASLLGAARDLLARPRGTTDDLRDLEVRTLGLASPHGALRAVPPPVLLGGRPVAAEIGRYGGAALAWA